MAYANETSNERYRAMTKEDQQRVKQIATRLAQQRLSPGDRVSRTLCGGRRGTFVFSGWDGIWAMGRSIADCHATAIIKINGHPVDFIAEALTQTGDA